jgi:hypothetical protein
MNIKIIILSGIIFVAFACQKVQNKNNIRNIYMNKIANYELNDICDSVRMIPISTNDSNFLGSIKKIMVFEDDLYILDRMQKAIFVYNCEGKLIRKICKVGNGPGEYLDIVDFTINKYNKQIEMIDGSYLRSYDFHGNFINKEKIANEKIKAIHHIAIIDTSYIAFLSLFEEDGALIYSRVAKKIVSAQNLVPAWTRTKIPFQTISRFYSNNNEIIYYEGFSNKVYQIDKSGFKIKYEWDFGDYNFNYDKPPLIKEFKRASSFKEILKRREYYTDRYIQTFQHNIENEKYIIRVCL